MDSRRSENNSGVQMFQHTLHEAMQVVLSERPNQTATTSELSEEIERRGLYIRKDGAAARAQQINARARKYPHLFEIDDSGRVHLVSNYSANESAA
jgi:antitoxin Phd